MSRREVIALIGAGSVGSGLVLSAKGKGHRTAIIVSRRLSSARRLGKIARVRRTAADLTSLPEDVTMVIIAVPDQEILPVVEQLVPVLKTPKRRMRIFHTSGSVSSDVLRPLRRKNISLCAIHPIRSFPPASRPGQIVRSLEGEWFGIEGTRKDQVWARSFVRSLGGKVVVIPKAKKTLYHIACTFASNYPLAVLRAAEIFADAARMKDGLGPLHALLLGSVMNGLTDGPMKAFTGPIARGDSITIRNHRSEIRKTAPHLLPLFEELVGFASREAEHAGRISQLQGRSLRRAAKR